MQKAPYTYLENGLLALATLVFGVMAGFFWTYSFNVNYAMLEVDGATYATMQSLFNENVRHTMFFAFFMGGAAFSVLALIGNWRRWRSLPFWLLAAAAIIYFLGVMTYTSVVFLPINYYTESWDPQNLPADWADVRNQWNWHNLNRVFTSGASFILTLGAMMIRATGGTRAADGAS